MVDVEKLTHWLNWKTLLLLLSHWISCFAQCAASWVIRYPTDPVRIREPIWPPSHFNSIALPLSAEKHWVETRRSEAYNIISQFSQSFAWAISSPRSIPEFPSGGRLLLHQTRSPRNNKPHQNKHVCRHRADFCSGSPFTHITARWMVAQEIGFWSFVCSLGRSIDRSIFSTPAESAGCRVSEIPFGTARTFSFTSVSSRPNAASITALVASISSLHDRIQCMRRAIMIWAHIGAD